MTEGKETVVVTLIFPDGYMHQLNEVAGVTTQNVVYLKRKFVSSAGCELIKYPLTEFSYVDYSEERSIARMVFGGLLAALILFIAVMIVVEWENFAPGTRISVGLLGLAGFYGVRMLFGARLNRLTFQMRDGTTLTWRSKAGSFELMRDSALRVLEFARQKGLAV